MKKQYLFSALLCCGLALGSTTVVSCSDNDNPAENGGNPGGNGGNGENVSSADLDYTAANSASWRNYSLQVAKLLQNDAQTLYNSWNTSYTMGGVTGPAYKETFINHNGGDYATAWDCVKTIIDKCVEITDEVGNTKIGDPYSKYMAGNVTEALYAVESWYSFRSREDYSNNIKSIRNSYFNSIDNTTIAANSLSKIVENLDADLNARVIAAIANAEQQIIDIPDPFRSHIGDPQVPVAQAACLDLGDIFDYDLRECLQSAINNGSLQDSQLDPVVSGYVNNVVLPTYKSLADGSVSLTAAVQAFYDTPSDDTFAAACEAWKVAREPWEKSEAFLFGPVDALGLDPNMDSWPLDQDAIVNILNSGNYDNLNWTDGDSDDAIEAAQNVRGFHTLEYLLFKNGQPRTVPAE